MEPPREWLGPPLPVAYEEALATILADRRQTLLVAEVGGRLVGTACVVVVPNLSHVGRPYAIIENVVMDKAARGQGWGERLMGRAAGIARAAGCHKVVLTSNKARLDDHRFYERLGFRATHEGFRLDL